MNISRRWFIGGIAALGAANVSKAVFAKTGAMSKNTPDLRIGMITDVHVAIRKNSDGQVIFAGTDVLRKTLEWYRDRDVDGIVITGDIADNGLVEEMAEFARIWFGVFPDGKTPSGKKVERLFVCGNHDWEGYRYSYARKIFGENAPQHALAANGFAAWEKIFGEKFEPIWKKELKGCAFVGGHWIASGCRGREEAGVPQAAPWFAANGASLDPSRPFFYLQHPLPKNTVNGSWAWGQDTGAVTAALSRFPNAIALSGHSHYSLTDERTIWQGAFTSIGLSSLKYVAIGYKDLGANSRENDGYGGNGPVNESPFKIMPNMSGRDGHHGILAHIYGDRIVYERRDFGDFSILGDDWVMPLPAAETRPFAHASRIAASVAPEFRASAKAVLKVEKGVNRGGMGVEKRKQAVLGVTIPCADAKDGVRPCDFELLFADASGKSVKRYVFADKWYRSLKIRDTFKTHTAKIALERLGLEGDISLEIRPRNSFGKAGKAIRGKFSYCPPPKPAEPVKAVPPKKA